MASRQQKRPKKLKQAEKNRTEKLQKDLSMLSVNEIRSSFIEFFEGKGHKFVPSSPVVPNDDKTLLFTNAGMNQFKNLFLGISKPEFPRAVNSQKCIRAGGKHNDLEEVGLDTYHHTFFEMLGNWSFGDYFKKEAIDWSWELLTEVWKMDTDRLHATYFEGDESDNIPPDLETKKLWSKYLPEGRIHPGNKKDNFWEMGSTGPCGPCSELHYDATKNKSGANLINKDHPEVIEIWNLVFMQYNRLEDSSLVPLPAKHVDTGAGLERIARFLQGKTSNYDIDVFVNLIGAIEKLCGKKYTRSMTDFVDIAFRVVADHLRTLVFAITDGATPSNESRGYVIRRILRRACRFGRQLGQTQPFLYKLVPAVVNEMGEAFEEIAKRASYVTDVIKAEEQSFGKTLDKGIEIFEKAAKKAIGDSNQINAEAAFKLYDTFGFPLDLTELMATEKKLTVDTDGFQQLMAEQKQRARKSAKTVDQITIASDVELPVTLDDDKYTTDEIKTKIVAGINDNQLQSSGTFEKSSKASLILDKTCFYAASGGQVGDTGQLKSAGGIFEVQTTTKIADSIIHHGIVTDGTISIGDDVIATVDSDIELTKKNHTATHLLQAALQKILGEDVSQKGSLVCKDYLRFDFTCPTALTKEQIIAVEKKVQANIDANLTVTCQDMPIAKAKSAGAIALFGEKYGDIVRVVTVSDDDKERTISKELCGGTHVAHTNQIKHIKIIKEESVSAGIRRITALTGESLDAYFTDQCQIVTNISNILKVPSDKIEPRITKLIQDNKKLTKELKASANSKGSNVLSDVKKLLDSCDEIDGSSIICHQLKQATLEQIRAAIDMLKTKAASCAVVLAVEENNKAIIAAGVTDDLVKKGLKAGDIVKTIAPIISGGGGGRPQMAVATGTDPVGIKDALAKAKEIIGDKLAN